MSTTVETTIRCDRPDGCSATFAGSGWPEAVRRKARRRGWTVQRDGDRWVELCPTHPPGCDDPAQMSLLDLVDSVDSTQ